MIVTPVLGNDQFYWAGRVNRLNLGKGFRKQLLRITAPELSEAIREVTTSAGTLARVKEMAETLQHEDGVEAATRVIAALARERAARGHQ